MQIKVTKKLGNSVIEFKTEKPMEDAMLELDAFMKKDKCDCGSTDLIFDTRKVNAKDGSGSFIYVKRRCLVCSKTSTLGKLKDGSGFELVDNFTGRIADKRRWPYGLQTAIEAKERLKVNQEGVILGSITLQHFLKLYPRISGMTATAQSAEEELKHFYNLNIVVVPPNKACIRKDHKDVILRRLRMLIQLST